jgi:two-component system, NarL family, sensor histidine kinase BarA
MFSGLRTQILFLALLPPLIIALFLGIYLNYSRVQDLQYFSDARGKSMLLELGINSQYAIENHQPELLQRLGNASLESKGVRAISFFNRDGDLLVHSGPSLHIKPLPEHLSVTDTIKLSNDNIVSFIAPIKNHNYTSNIQQQDNFNNKDNLLGWVAIEYNQDSITIQTHQQLFIQNIMLLAGLIFSGLIGLKLAQRINNDIKSINQTVKKIKEGETTHHLDVSSSQEMRSLANNIEDMATHLKNEFDELRHNVEITTNDLKETIETIEIQNIELNLAKKEALTASKTKSEFLANTSHEIRTPLNGIIGFTKILKKTALNTQQSEYVDTIQQSSENLLTIMNDILDFSKIEAGKLELEVAPFNIRHTFEECVNLFAPYAYEKNIEIVLLIYQDVPNNILGDSLRIKQIVSNLLSNAVKFTREGTITIRVFLESINEDHVDLSISVSDTGVGMTALQQKNIFQAFTQANTSTSREYGGTGLGLAIVKKLVELMHDDIKVESTLNEGSTFSFILKTRIADHQEWLVYEKLTGKTMLLIEKHPLLNLSIKHLLTSYGVHALVAASLDEAIQLLSEYYVDAIIYGFSPTHSHDIQLTEIVNLTKHTHPLLLLISSQAEKAIQHLHADNIRLCYKPLTESRLYLGLYDIFYPKNIPSLQRPTAKTLAEKPLHILAVDDHQANLKLLKVLLNDLGFTVSTAADGKEAIEICQETIFDIIFMDIQMPVINGINATKYIREEVSKNQGTPIIAITAHAMADEKDAIFKAGMNDYITKPINEDQLKAVIAKWCEIPETHHQAFIDIALCLKLANFKQDLAIDMFTMLVDGLEADISHIETALANNDAADLLDRVHKLHGACCYTGVPQLKAAAQRFEFAIKNEDSGQYGVLFNALAQSARLIMEWDKQNELARMISSVNNY